MATMKKYELVKRVAEKMNITQTDAQDVLDSVVECIKEALKEGERINLKGFGIFEVRDRAAHEGRNPKTGEVIQIAAAKHPAFKVSAQFKNYINDRT
jgi:DNA-binding protein HU-beta